MDAFRVALRAFQSLEGFAERAGTGFSSTAEADQLAAVLRDVEVACPEFDTARLRQLLEYVRVASGLPQPVLVRMAGGVGVSLSGLVSELFAK